METFLSTKIFGAIPQLSYPANRIRTSDLRFTVTTIVLRFANCAMVGLLFSGMAVSVDEMFITPILQS